jgi:amino acid transporter
MKKNVLVFGTIAGVLVSTFMFFSMLTMRNNPNFEGSMLVGYASMLVAFSLIFVAIKNYRDKYNNGLVTFGKAFQIGLYIALIASTCYVITWAFEYHFMMPDFMEAYSQHLVEQLIKDGATDQEITKQTTMIAENAEMYKNPLFFALFTYMEILPVGLVVSLISALILKRKEHKPNIA